jgi:glucosamine--fructose-6-phosphate aminotransferase (isomerizing)
MCGIVGIISDKPVAGALVDGLKRLEYRGYDSAGIATLIDGRIERRRAEGKLVNLASRLEREPLAGTIGIAHTRGDAWLADREERSSDRDRQGRSRA